MPNSAALASSVSTCLRLSSSLMSFAMGVPSVGVLWSAVASVRSGRRTVRPARRRASKACGLVTSWTRRRSMNSSPGATSWASQSLSNSVLGISLLLAAAQSGRHDGEEARLVGPGVLEVMGQVGVEGDGVAGGELVALAVDDQRHGAGLHVGDLATARLVHRRGPRAAGDRAGGKDVVAELGPQAGQRRGQDLDGVAATATAAAH